MRKRQSAKLKSSTRITTLESGKPCYFEMNSKINVSQFESALEFSRESRFGFRFAKKLQEKFHV